VLGQAADWSFALKLLALDTATEACSAAVLVNDEIIERYEIAPRRHAALILPMLEAVLAEAGLNVAQLNALAFGCGPGAFTGIRIASGVIQGIAFAADLPVAPISTLAAIAKDTVYQHGVDRVVATIDARMGEIYWGTYMADSERGVLLVGEEQVCSPDTAPLLVEGEWHGAGSGWLTHAESLQRRLGITTWWGDSYPRAGDIAMLGALACQRGETVAAELALPVYLRDKVVNRGS
jgi:tRNA threonylcarbamoyladenosine biosynthesis protein TsaB